MYLAEKTGLHDAITAAPAIAAPITVAYGDGIGPEIMTASLRVLEAAGAALAIKPIEIGEAIYRAGHSSGIAQASWDSLRRTRVFYKAPITTPQGSGYKSLNVTIRKTLGLYANIRPNLAYAPFVATQHSGMDVVIVRENEEDLYAGIEHRQTSEVYQCLKLVSRPGCERIVRYAFDYARQNGRRKVTCVTKDNIMKLTDGLFHKVFDEIAPDYPEITAEHMIVDIGAARLAVAPERFDVIVAPNLYGDILSDIAAEVAGSVGLAPSANIGTDCAMFEAVHGSAPDIAGRDIANPSGLLLAGAMMLVHVGQPDIAARVQNAWRRTIEDGIHTADIHVEGKSTRRVGTQAFADAVIARLGSEPAHLAAVVAAPAAPASTTAKLPARRTPHAPGAKVLVGVDVFVDHTGPVAELAEAMQAAVLGAYGLQMITNRGVKVWPNGVPETHCTDHWRCRYIAEPGKQFNRTMVIDLLRRLAALGVDFIKTEHLYRFDGEAGFSLGQGQ